MANGYYHIPSNGRTYRLWKHAEDALLRAYPFDDGWRQVTPGRLERVTETAVTIAMISAHGPTRVTDSCPHPLCESPED